MRSSFCERGQFFEALPCHEGDRGSHLISGLENLSKEKRLESKNPAGPLTVGGAIQHQTIMRRTFLILPLLLASPTVQAGPLDDFASQVEHGLDGRCVGYGYAIYQNGNYVRGGGGGVRKYGDPNNQFDPGLPFDQHTVKDCHSMSKTITSAALLKALGDAGVGLEAKMWLHLPKIMQDAISDEDIKDVTFRNLLEHRSGFGGSANYSWAEIRSQIQGGLKNPIGDYEYCNVGYAMCRLLIPYLLREDYYRDFEAQAPLWNQQFFLPTMCANDYSDFVNSDIFALAGLPTIHPRPVNSTINKFAWYYDYITPTDPGELMPDRRLTVGSGGWALSAKQYGKFISALFNNQVVSGTQLGWMKSGNLGMMQAGAIDGGENYRLHNGATNSGNKGGRSIWMHFPADNIQIAIQINSARNSYSADGMGLSAIVGDAYERAYSTPPWSQQWSRHIFVRRESDGWTAGRGIGSDGKPADRNYDGHAPAGFTHARFFDVGGQPFVLHYKPVNGGGKGRAVMQKVDPDGTIGATVFDTPNWMQGWTHVETFKSFQGTFLLLHNHNTGRVRTFKVSPLGTLGAAITDHVYSSGFEILEIIDFGAGDPHLFRHNPVTGQTHLRKLNDDGSVGATAYDKVWTTGFSDFAFYRAGNSNYLLRYNPADGHARIISFGASLNTTQLVLDQNWSDGWALIRFFESGNKTYNFRYNPENGRARIQEINANGTFGEIPYDSTKWLMARSGSGSFDPPTTGWTAAEFYDATPGYMPPNTVAENPNLPPAESGPSIEPLQAEAVPARFDAETFPPLQADIKIIRGSVQIDWPSESGMLYLLEESTALVNWTVSESIVGDDSQRTVSLLPDPATGAPAPRKFVRVRGLTALSVPGSARPR